MHVYCILTLFTAHQQQKNVWTPHFFGLATPLGSLRTRSLELTLTAGNNRMNELYHVSDVQHMTAAGSI